MAFIPAPTAFYLMAQSSSVFANYSSTAPVDGSVLGFACDLGSRLLWVSKDGVYYNGDPGIPTGGMNWGGVAAATMFPVFQSTVTAIPPVATINTGSSLFVGAIPAGYAAWGGTDP